MSILFRDQIPNEELFVLATIAFGAAYVASPKRVLDPETQKDMHYLAFGHQSARDLFVSLGLGSVQGETTSSQGQSVVKLLAETAELRAKIEKAKKMLEPIKQQKAVAEAIKELGPGKWGA